MLIKHVVYTICVIVLAISVLKSADLRLEWWSYDGGDLSGRDQSYENWVLSGGGQNYIIVGWRSLEGGGVTEITSHRSRRESLLDMNASRMTRLQDIKCSESVALT